MTRLDLSGAFLLLQSNTLRPVACWLQESRYFSGEKLFQKPKQIICYYKRLFTFISTPLSHQLDVELKERRFAYKNKVIIFLLENYQLKLFCSKNLREHLKMLGECTYIGLFFEGKPSESRLCTSPISQQQAPPPALRPRPLSRLVGTPAGSTSSASPAGPSAPARAAGRTSASRRLPPASSCAAVSRTSQRGQRVTMGQNLLSFDLS